MRPGHTAEWIPVRRVVLAGTHMGSTAYAVSNIAALREKLSIFGV